MRNDENQDTGSNMGEETPLNAQTKPELITNFLLEMRKSEIILECVVLKNSQMDMPFRDMEFLGREEEVCERTKILSTFICGALGASQAEI